MEHSGIRERGFNALERTVFDSWCWPRLAAGSGGSNKSWQNPKGTSGGLFEAWNRSAPMHPDAKLPNHPDIIPFPSRALFWQHPCQWQLNLLCHPLCNLPRPSGGAAILIALKSQVAALHFPANCTLNGSMAKAPLGRKLLELTHTVINGWSWNP